MYEYTGPQKLQLQDVYYLYSSTTGGALLRFMVHIPTVQTVQVLLGYTVLYEYTQVFVQLRTYSVYTVPVPTIRTYCTVLTPNTR